MTTTELAPKIISPAQGRNCSKCHRVRGQARSPQTLGDGLLPVNELIVCDRCWRAAGGEDAVVTTIDDHGHLTVDLEGPPEFEALVAAVEEYDARHPIDRCLIEAGIRWETLRWIAVPARCDLVRYVLERVPPRYSRLALSPDAWMEAVAARIEAQTGTEFKYNPKRRRWWRIANVLRCCSDWQGRPLSWVSQEEIAAAVGCSTRTVRRCVAWLQREGLLHEVLPGLELLPRQAVPDDETAAEQAEREARAAAAKAAEDAAVARARAELDAVRGGLFGDQAADAAEAALSPEHAAALAAVEELEPAAWVQLVPVYELRVPMSAAEIAEEAAIARAHTKLAASPGEALARHYAAELVPVRNASVYRELAVIGHDGQLTSMTGPDAANAVTSGNAVGLLRPDQFGHPPQVILSDQLKSSGIQPVDKIRPASPGSDEGGAQSGQNGAGLAVGGQTAPSEGDRPKAPQSEAVRAAEWLIQSRLHPVLCEDVSVHWLAGLIRGSRLLSTWRWTWDDLADLIHGVPEYPHLPYDIRSARGWIKARFQRAIAPLPPAALRQRLAEPDTDRELLHEHARLVGASDRLLALIIRDNETSQRRRDRAEQARLAEGAAKRAAREACPICDTEGWFHADPTDPTAPLIRCSHDPETGGW